MKGCVHLDRWFLDYVLKWFTCPQTIKNASTNELIATRPEVESTTFWSHVQHTNHYTAKSLGTKMSELESKDVTEACDRSIVSKMRLITADIWMTSPLMRQSFLLSSSTVFMFSTQTASIGPSKTTHLRSGVVSVAYSRNVFAVIPSDHCAPYTLISLFLQVRREGKKKKLSRAPRRLGVPPLIKEYFATCSTAKLII